MDPHPLITPHESPLAQIVQVLFMDIVGFSKFERMRDQEIVLSQLEDIVRNTDEYRRLEGSDSVLCRSTGDGMAVVFFTDLLAPVRCAIEISKRIKRQKLISLRMGIHLGPVYRRLNINRESDVTGDGINIAQRVMDGGDGNHILLSQFTRQLLRQLGEFDDCIKEIGLVKVKDRELLLYNFYGTEFGNPARSTKWPALPEQRIPPAKRPALREEPMPPPRQPALREELIAPPKRQSNDPKYPPVSHISDCERCGMLLSLSSTTCVYCGAKLLGPK